MSNRVQVKVWLCALMCAVLGMSAVGVEVTSTQAQTAVKNWVRKNPRAMNSRFKANSGEVETVPNAFGRALCHVVNLDGGGFVVTSGDTKLSPIIAFSDSGTFTQDPHNPLFAMLQRDMTGRLAAIGESQEANAPVRKLISTSASTNGTSTEKAKTKNEKAWEELLVEPKPVLMAVASSSQLDDVRVEPLVKTEWGQADWGNCTGIATYNLYTPKNYVCGCMATAAAQIMKYFAYSNGKVVSKTVKCTVDGVGKNLTMQGGIYDYARMPNSYSEVSKISQIQCEAIGKLTSDIGIAMGMGYSNGASGTSTMQPMVSNFKNVFGYADARLYYSELNYPNRFIEDESLANAILASLDAGCPVAIGGFGDGIGPASGTTGGHCFIYDGYGFKNGIAFVHINFGWSGVCNVWYDIFGEKPDTSAAAPYLWRTTTYVGYNIHPTECGNVVSGRVLDNVGKPVIGANVTLRDAEGRIIEIKKSCNAGIYYFRVNQSGKFTLSADNGVMLSKTGQVELPEHVDYEVVGQIFYQGKWYDQYFAGVVANKWGVDLTLEDAADVNPEPPEPVAAPVFNPAESSFTTSSLSVSISCGTSGATIRYTKDGTEPTMTSPIYSSAIKITATTTFKAKAFKNGMADSSVTTKIYTKVVVKPTITPQEALGWSGKVTISDSELVCGQDVESHDGKNALKISCTTEKTSATASISVNGPGILSFWWAGAERVVTTSGDKTSESNYMICSIDGRTVAIRGRSNYQYMDWRKVNVQVPEGMHVIEWETYATFPKGNRTGYIDEVSFTPYAGGVRTIRFNANGADEGELEKTEITGVYTDQIIMPGQGTLVREGYAFVGWIKDPSSAVINYESESTYTIGMEDETFYACWHRIVDVQVEFPQEGGEQEVRIDGYGNSFETDTMFPDWAGKFMLIGRGKFTVTISLGNGRKNLSIGTDELYLNFTAEPNDTESDRSFDLSLIAHDYPLVVRYHIVQKGDVTSDKLKGLLVQCADSVVSGQSIKLTGSAIRRNSRVDAISPTWEIVSGAGNGSLSSGGWLTASKVTSAKTMTIRASYKEGEIECAADKVVTVLPSCDLNTALDNVDCEFTSNGWSGQVGDSVVGDSSARCGSCYEETSVLSTSVMGPCRVSFDCRVTCGNGGGNLVFVDNGKTNFCACAVPMTSSAWMNRSFRLAEEGEHRLEWVYFNGMEDLSSVVMDDSAWLDGLVVEELTIYGPWGESESVKNPDKLGPTMLTDMTLELNGAAGAVGDVVAVFRSDTGALCGLGKVMDDSGTLSMVCYAPTGVKLHFKIWVAASGLEEPIVVDCDKKSDLTAPTSGAFLSGHSIVVSDDKNLTISLGSADWHTVSFNVLPEDPSPAEVFGSVKTKIAAVTQGIEFWMPGKSSSLKTIEIGKGYWVNTKVDNVEWTISGKTDPKATITLEEGWNLVGYAPESEGAVQTVLKTALAEKAIDYVTYGVEFYPGGMLTKMEPGKAYWVHAKKAWTFVYDEPREALKAMSLFGNGQEVPTYGPWGESEAVKNPDKLGPTFLTNMMVEIDGEPAMYGDVVAVFRGDTGALCGLGKVMDDSGTLTAVCYVPKGVTLSFKIWLAESGVEEAIVVRCDNASKLIAPESGAFYDGHEISGTTAEIIETIVPGAKVEIDTGLGSGYTASGLPSGLKYNRTTGIITGAATKPTAAEGTVVKFTKSGVDPEELTIIVTAIPKVSVTMEGVNSPSDTDNCKVTGAGAFLVGRTVTLKATAPKGVVFMGWFVGGSVVATQATYTFTMDKEDVALVAKFKKEVMTVGCEGLSEKEYFPAGVTGAEDGIALNITTESGVKSIKVDKLPTGMKYDSKLGLIIGAPTKAGDNTVVITVTAVSGAVEKKEIKVAVKAMPVMAVGKFDGFVLTGNDNAGTLTLTTTDAGKLTAKVITAAGTVSFSGTCWDTVKDGVYRATLTTKNGEKLTLVLDSTAAWDANQLSGAFTTAAKAETKKTAAVPSRTYWLLAQRNAFSKTWYFAAEGNEATGWKFAYAEDSKTAAFTVTMKADGSTVIAGKLPNGVDENGRDIFIKVSASGYANVGGLQNGVILADFAPVMTVNKVKKVLAIKTNLWFDCSDGEVMKYIGSAKFVE